MVQMDDRVICFQLCGDRDDPSVSVSNTAYCIPANPMSDRGQAVCIAIDQQGGKGNCCYAENVMPTLCSDSHGTPHAVCYENQTDVVAFDGYNIDSSINTFKTITAGRNDTHNLPVACYEAQMDVICIEGHIIDRKTSENGCGWRDGGAYTLNATDRHAVCFPVVIGKYLTTSHETAVTLEATDYKEPQAVCFPVESFGHDERSTQFSKNGCCDTLTSSDYKQPIIVAYEKSSEVLAFKERAGCPGGGKGILIAKDRAFTLATNPTGAICCEVYDARGNGDGGVAPTLTGDHQNRVTDYTALLVKGADTTGGSQMKYWDGTETTGTLTARNAGGAQRMPDKENFNAVIQASPQRKYVLRRLTPLECARLQGFPDWWTDGVEGSDSNQYKMWGNGIALPCAADVIGRIVKAVRERKDENDE